MRRVIDKLTQHRVKWFIDKFRDNAPTWPSLAVRINLLPWHWRIVPRGWYDYSPRSWDESPADRRAGWWSLTGQWLMVEIDFGFNLPPFCWTEPPA